MKGNSLVKKTSLFILFKLSLFASFSGTVIDKETSNPIANATINDSQQTIITDENGSFNIEGNETKYFVKAHGYRPFSFNSDLNISKIEIEPIIVKALYLTFWGASNNSQTLKKVLKIIDETEVNAIVMDIKSEYGLTSYLTSFEQANSYGAHKQRT
ncbi:MAG: putative glycoside hydrolase, partial [Campylobacterota bacterium]|nr:putative glycoside hydrolase [Campylobacterota bacterium]